MGRVPRETEESDDEPEILEEANQVPGLIATWGQFGMGEEGVDWED